MKAMRPKRNVDAEISQGLHSKGWHIHVRPIREPGDTLLLRRNPVVDVYYIDPAYEGFVQSLACNEAGEHLDKIAVIPFACSLCRKLPCVCEPSS